MKRLLAAMGMLLLASSAYGADLSVAPLVTKAPAPVPIWTGFYAGINAGGGWGTSQTAIENFAITNNPTSGLILGGQLGYNYQLAPIPIVVGVEVEGDWSGVQGNGPCGVAVGCTQIDRLSWTADVAGRVGYAFDRFLPYVKGGVVWGDLSHQISVPVGRLNNGADVDTGSASATRTGWLLGAGLEYAITPHLSAKLEYNLLDFGSVSETFSFTGPSLGNNTVTVSGTSKDQVNLFKGGLNYKF